MLEKKGLLLQGVFGLENIVRSSVKYSLTLNSLKLIDLILSTHFGYKRGDNLREAA